MTTMAAPEPPVDDESALGWPVSRETFTDADQPSEDLGWPA